MPPGDPPPDTPPTLPMPPGFALNGTVSGAGRVVRNAAVSVYRVGRGGYGSAGTLLGSGTTDATGHWTVSFDEPSDNPLIYVLVDGGDAGQGANNALALMAGVGPINGAPTVIHVNEVTTVAAVYALTQFLDSPTRNVGAPASNATGLANAFMTISNLVDGAGGAFSTANPFVPMIIPGNGVTAAPPGKTVNTLANAIAACIDSNGRASTPCTTLFSITAGLGSSAPSDTRAALLAIAKHPAGPVQPLVTLSHSDGAPNQPDFGVDLPNDWTLSISFFGDALAFAAPTDVVLDSSGFLYLMAQGCELSPTSPQGCVVKLQPNGLQAGVFPTLADGNILDLGGLGRRGLAIATDPDTRHQTVFVSSNRGSYVVGLDAQTLRPIASSPLTNGGLIVHPEEIAADEAGNLWVVDEAGLPQPDGTANVRITQVLAGPQDTYSTFTNFLPNVPPGPDGFNSIDVLHMTVTNGASALWLSDFGSGRMLRFDISTPGQLGPLQRFETPYVGGPAAADPSGNVWVANEAGVGVVEFVSGTPIGVRSFPNNTVFSPGGIAADGAGRLWISNVDRNAIKGLIEIDVDGSSVPATTAVGAFIGGYPKSVDPLGPEIVGTFPRGVAIDSTGNVWVAGGQTRSLVQFVGAATPVTPGN
ncbi:MAG TPA: hypothetical protein VGM84_14785 [Steroidobacteraceae bacterium]